MIEDVKNIGSKDFDAKITIGEENYIHHENYFDIERNKEFIYPKEKTHGFHYTMFGKKIIVFFEYFKEMIIKCHLIIQEEDVDNDLEFIGVAKVYEEKDIYFKDEGERISLQKAIDKSIKFFDSIIDSICIKQEKINNMLINDISKKLIRIQKK